MTRLHVLATFAAVDLRTNPARLRERLEALSWFDRLEGRSTLSG